MAKSKTSYSDLIQTSGTFEVVGLVTGTKSDRFYSEKQTTPKQKVNSQGKTYMTKSMPNRVVNFGVEFEKGKVLYLSLTGLPRDNVYFSGKQNPNDDKNTTVTVPWAERLNFNQEGMRLIGVNLGLSKKVDETGKQTTSNDSKTWTEFDACEVLNRELEDGMSVYCRGKIDYQSYKNKNGDTVRIKKFVPTQISLTSNPVELDKLTEENPPVSNFTQTIVLTDIEMSQEDKCAYINGYVVNYADMQPTQFKTYNQKLAKTLSSVCKKDYVGIDVYGHIDVIKSEEEVEVDDGWGEANTMKRVNAPTTREMIVIGADPKTLDEEGYTKKLVEDALNVLNKNKKAEEQFGKDEAKEANDWGTPNLEIAKSEDDDEDWSDWGE